MTHLIPGFALMAAAVGIHLVGGLAVVLYLRPRMRVEASYPLLHALGLVIVLFVALLVLHLMQVGLWALLYWWQIGWDFSTALYFSTVTYATIGYGDVVPPAEWRLVAVMQGLTGVLMLGWSSAMVFALVSCLLGPFGIPPGAGVPDEDEGRRRPARPGPVPGGNRPHP